MKLPLDTRQVLDSSANFDTNLDENGEIQHARHDMFYYVPNAIGSLLITAAAILIIWLLAGSLHARSRARRGLKPLAYHKILLKPSERARFEPQRKNISLDPEADQGYPMEPPQTPPPVYNPEPASPPGYVTSPDSSNVASSQNWVAQPTITADPQRRSSKTDLERGMAPNSGSTMPVKGGQFQKLRERITSLQPFNR